MIYLKQQKKIKKALRSISTKNIQPNITAAKIMEDSCDQLKFWWAAKSKLIL